MMLLECGDKPRKIKQKAADKPRKITVQEKGPAEMDISRISSVRSQKLRLGELRLRKPKLREPRLREPGLRKPWLRELILPIHLRTIIYTMK